MLYQQKYLIFILTITKFTQNNSKIWYINKKKKNWCWVMRTGNLREPVVDQRRFRDSPLWGGLMWMTKSVSPLRRRLSIAHFRASLLPWEKSKATPIALPFDIFVSSQLLIHNSDQIVCSGSEFTLDLRGMLDKALLFALHNRLKSICVYLFQSLICQKQVYNLY